MRKKGKATPPPRPETVRKRVWLLAAAFFFVEIAVLPGAASPFRAPKSGIALAAILLVVGVSAAAAIARGRLVLRWSPPALVLVTLPVLQAVSMLWSGGPRLALDAALSSAVWIAGALWLATVAEREHRCLVDVAAAGAAVSGLVLVVQAALGASFAVGSAGPTGRLGLTGLTGNPADLAAAAVLMLPLILTGHKNRLPAHRLVLALLLTGAAVVSQTITALVALAMVWGIWLVRRRSRRLWSLTAIVVVLLTVVGFATGLDDRFRRQVQRLQEGDWYFLLSARGDGWTAAGEMVRSRPIAGTGAANFTHAYYPSRVSWLERTGTVGSRAELATHFRHAHCDPLQLTAELGLIGALWLAGLLVTLYRSRPRGDPLPLLASAGFLPFAFLHFPTHLAVGLVPVILVLGRWFAAGREVVVAPTGWTRRVGSLVLIVVVALGLYWQVHTLTLNLWRGGLSFALASAERLDSDRRARQAAAVEAQVLPRIQALKGARPWLWRTVGQARMARGDAVGAESAFRTAMSLWPHEEAEFGLGLALAEQDRRLNRNGARLGSRNLRGEAVMHLARVCRTNPALLGLIPDPDLRRAVAQIVDASNRQRPASD